MLNFDRTMIQAEMDYRGEKLRRGVTPKRRNRFADARLVPFGGAPEVVKQAR